jgi:hypothetical protein
VEFVETLRQTWGADGLVAFEATPCTAEAVPVRFVDNLRGLLDYAEVGPKAAGPLSVGLQLSRDYLNGQPRDSFPGAVAHAMGHVLGFLHEEDHPDSTCEARDDYPGGGVALTAYDPESIMNFCAGKPKTGPDLLTPQDREGFRRAYGAQGAPSCDTIHGLPVTVGPSQAPVTLTVQNACAFENLSAWWVDFQGREVLLSVLTPGQKANLLTYPNHNFSFRNAATGMLVAETRSLASSASLVLPAPGGSCSPFVQRPTTLGPSVGGHAELRIVNQCASAPVRVNWIDYQGVERTIATVLPRQTLSLQSYINHSWVFRHATTGEVLGQTRMPQGPQTVTLP